ncbi:type II toxin-antitoxin system RelE/ParE family toxin [Rhizobium sp. Root149]|uniref:type II toxin-antitoxin system RelE family toxin n=1 Tax=Rhizobium sp. Root149 TaxID=1736473 RepID=UPI0009E78B76|nr:type II toxin-antitoxin system RelE/ParE family toxin [Rhizobium sp. Root149]
MVWNINYSNTAFKILSKLDKATAKSIIDYMDHRIATCDDPRQFGKPLTGSLKGRWRYRVGDHRTICRITDSSFDILVIEIGHRREVYRKQKGSHDWRPFHEYWSETNPVQHHRSGWNLQEVWIRPRAAPSSPKPFPCPFR